MKASGDNFTRLDSSTASALEVNRGPSRIDVDHIGAAVEDGMSSRIASAKTTVTNSRNVTA